MLKFNLQISFKKKSLLCKGEGIYNTYFITVCKLSDTIGTVNIQHDGRCTYNVTFWCVPVITAATEMLQSVRFTVELHVTLDNANNIKLSVSQ